VSTEAEKNFDSYYAWGKDGDVHFYYWTDPEDGEEWTLYCYRDTAYDWVYIWDPEYRSVDAGRNWYWVWEWGPNGDSTCFGYLEDGA